jgi:hypothetical protein
MRHLAEQYEGRFAKDQNNPGASLIWLNKSGGKSVAAEQLFFSSELKKPSHDNWFDQALRHSKKK